MFDTLCTFLLRLYPAEFRRAYGQDALQLIRDRARHERGVLLRARLALDLAIDLFLTWLTWRPAEVAVARVVGGPRFETIEGHRPRPSALAAGMLTSMTLFAGFTLLFQPRAMPDTPAQVGDVSGGEPTAASSSSDAEKEVVVGDSGVTLVTVIAAHLQQRYVERAIGQQLASTLIAYEKSGRYAAIATWPELAKRITSDIYERGREMGIPPGAFVAEVIYSERPLPADPPLPTAAAIRERRAALLDQNCLFTAIETLPGNIGYVKVDGFAEPEVCQETASRAMSGVRNADALILDLRHNGGGVGETALHIAGYLFNRPTFLYDPRPHSRVPSHTASPVSGHMLASKPLYVLTSSRTQSAAEYLVYNLKMLNRVTLVGERTAGEQHSGVFRRLSDHFGIAIQETPPPDNPYPVKGWEMIGVEPDVKVSQADALDVATKLAAFAVRSR